MGCINNKSYQLPNWVKPKLTILDLLGPSARLGISFSRFLIQMCRIWSISVEIWSSRVLIGSNSILNGVKTYILVQFDLWTNQNLRMHISSKSIFKIFVRWKCVREYVSVQKCSSSPYLWLKFVGYWYHNSTGYWYQYSICHSPRVRGK